MPKKIFASVWPALFLSLLLPGMYLPGAAAKPAAAIGQWSTLPQALQLGAISFDAVKMLLLARLEKRPVRFDLTFYPYLPAATVRTTDPPSH